MSQSMEDLANYAERFANAGATRSMYKTIASGAAVSVEEQKVDLVVSKASALAIIESMDTSKYSTAGKSAHAELAQSLKNIK